MSQIKYVKREISNGRLVKVATSKNKPIGLHIQGHLFMLNSWDLKKMISMFQEVLDESKSK